MKKSLYSRIKALIVLLYTYCFGNFEPSVSFHNRQYRRTQKANRRATHPLKKYHSGTFSPLKPLFTGYNNRTNAEIFKLKLKAI